MDPTPSKNPPYQWVETSGKNKSGARAVRNNLNVVHSGVAWANAGAAKVLVCVRGG